MTEGLETIKRQEGASQYKPLVVMQVPVCTVLDMDLYDALSHSPFVCRRAKTPVLSIMIRD